VRLPGRKPTAVDTPTEAPWHGEPFAIVVADAVSGRGHVVHEVRARDAAFFLLGSEDGVWWTHDGRLLFLSEKDGWQRLYALPGAGGTPVALSPPGCEVQQLTLAHDRKSAITVSNCDDRERRHLARVDLAGSGGWSALTSGRGLEHSPVALADGRV